MKFIFAAFIILGISGTVLCESNLQNLQGIPEIINGIITGIIDKVKTALPDPLSIPKVNVSFDYGNAASGSLMIENVIETGAKSFETTNVETRILGSTINVIINVPNVNVNGNYFIDLLLGTVVPIYGEGPFNVHLKNLQFNLTAGYSLNVFKLNLQLHNTSLITTLGDAVFDLHGVLNNEDFSVLFSEVTNDNFDVFINNYTKLISSVSSPILEKVINAVLNKKKTLMAIDEDEIRNAGYEFIEELKQHPQITDFLSFQ